MAKQTPWKLQDAKARFSELVRKARAGEPQHVTVHGKDAVIIVDAERFESAASGRTVKHDVGLCRSVEKVSRLVLRELILSGLRWM